MYRQLLRLSAICKYSFVRNGSHFLPSPKSSTCIIQRFFTEIGKETSVLPESASQKELDDIDRKSFSLDSRIEHLFHGEYLFPNDSFQLCLKDCFEDSSNSIPYETRKKLLHTAFKEKNRSKQPNSNQRNEEYQKILSCIESIRGLGKEPLSQWTSFLEHLILENEKNPTVYNELLEIYNQRIQNGNDRGSHYIDYDTVQAVILLWKKIQKNEIFLPSSSLLLLLKLSTSCCSLLHIVCELPRYVLSIKNKDPSAQFCLSMNNVLPILTDLLYSGYFKEFSSLESLLFYELDCHSPYTPAVEKALLSCQCYYREEDLVWEAVKDHYEKALGNLSASQRDDLDRVLLEKLLIAYVRQGNYSACCSILRFATTSLIPIKTTSLLKVMTESTKSFLNPQVTITAKERQQLFHSLHTFIHTIGISSPFNMALPYKLFYAVGSNDSKAIEEYTKLFLETYSPEFLEHYLYSYSLLAYQCTDEFLPNKHEIIDRVMKILEDHGCYNDVMCSEILDRETDEKWIVKLLNRMIQEANNKRNLFGIESCFVDPHLFSKAVRNTQLSSQSFSVLVDFMNENGIPITEEFLLNSFQSMLCSEENLNDLLDIIDSFCDGDENGKYLSGEYWRCLMNLLTKQFQPQQNEYDSIRSISQSNRNSIILSLLRYFRQDNISFCYLHSFSFLHSSFNLYSLKLMKRIEIVFIVKLNGFQQLLYNFWVILHCLLLSANHRMGIYYLGLEMRSSILHLHIHHLHIISI